MVFNAIEGISRFFQLLYTGAISIWQSFSLIVIFLIFIGVQIGFIYIYYKLFALLLVFFPKVKELFYKIDKALS